MSYDKQRPNSNQRGYGARWRAARVVFLSAHPKCWYCEQLGRLSAATVVDHFEPHKGDQQLFWDESNWRAACAPCHNSRTASHDGGWGNPLRPKSIAKGCDANGQPISPMHHWNKHGGASDAAGALSNDRVPSAALINRNNC